MNIKSANKKTNALALLKRAIKLQKSEKPTSTWCVFDSDENTLEQLTEAQKLAVKHNIKIILSTPCFEIWYLLHFKYTTSPFIPRNSVFVSLEEEIPNYSKTECQFSLLQLTAPRKLIQSKLENAIIT